MQRCEYSRISEDDIAAMRALPSWGARLALARPTAREVRAEDAYVFRSERFAEVVSPTLLLVGGESPAVMRATSEAVDGALRDSRIKSLPGQPPQPIS